MPTDLLPMVEVLAELDPDKRSDPPGCALTALRAQREARIERRQQIVEGAKREQRDALLASEQREFERLGDDLKGIDDLIGRTIAKAEREANRYVPGRSGVYITSEQTTYSTGSGRSYFLDLIKSAREADVEAQDRLRRHAKEVSVDAEARVRQGQLEYRDLTRTDGAGGQFVPPLHLIDQWVALARASRPTANVLNRRPLPGGTDSINFPVISTGTATAVQASDNAVVQETDLTDSTLAAPVRTIAGQQDVAVQLLEQSPVNFDEVVFADLMADYAAKLDAQVLNGTGASGQVTGLRTVSGTNAITYTDTTPTVGEAYPKIADAIHQIAANRYLPATHIVMAPRRWAWLTAALDAQGRPLVVPSAGGGVNVIGTSSQANAEGVVGEVQGLPVVVDPSIPTNLGAGANEDQIIVLRSDDIWLYESAIRTRVLPDVGSGTLTTRCQVYGYVAMATRYAKSISLISGTGLTPPAL